jgi:hypothetical protein
MIEVESIETFTPPFGTLEVVPDGVWIGFVKYDGVWKLKQETNHSPSKIKREVISMEESMSSVQMEIEIWRKKKMGRKEPPKKKVTVIEDKRLVEVFEKRLETFKGLRMAVQTKSIPMNENLARIDALLDEHSNEMYSTMLLFQGNIIIYPYNLGLKT